MIRVVIVRLFILKPFVVDVAGLEPAMVPSIALPLPDKIGILPHNLSRPEHYT